MMFIEYLKTHKVRLKSKWNEIIFKMLPLTIIGSLILYFGEDSVIYHKFLPSFMFAVAPIFAGIVGTLILWIEERNKED